MGNSPTDHMSWYIPLPGNHGNFNHVNPSMPVSYCNECEIICDEENVICVETKFLIN